MAWTGDRRQAQPALSDPEEILELAKARIAEVVPDVDLSAFAVAFTLVRAAERFMYELETAQRPMEWTWPGFRVLFWIWLFGELEPRRIATLASASRASVSSALNTLERNGFVVRRRDSTDRRLVTVELTEKGTSRMAEALGAANRRERDLLAGFSAGDRRTLAGLLGRLVVSNVDDQGS